MSDPPIEDLPSQGSPSPRTATEPPEDLLARITNREFNEWYSEQQFQENILEGKPYFNGPSPAKDPERHTPSKLLQCHRKATYTRLNAPREGTPPEGLFWIGSVFEEQVIVPYLQDVIPRELYVQNSLWIDTTIVSNGTELHVHGSTDPVIVTANGDPVLLTEVKTTTSLDHLTEPKPHHKAQLHVYLHALDDEYDEISVSEGLLVYGSRKTLDLKSFAVTFDDEFWETVVKWMETQTQYEQAGELPPATPERDWECTYCSFKHRCGEADTPYQDSGVDGLLPLFDGYDRQNLSEYLEGHADAGAKLTPTLAHAYPDLAETYGAYDWSCPRCSATQAWDTIEWDGDNENPPFCPECLEEDKLLKLSGPEPDTQLDRDN